MTGYSWPRSVRKFEEGFQKESKFQEKKSLDTRVLCQSVTVEKKVIRCPRSVRKIEEKAIVTKKGEEKSPDTRGPGR